MCSWCSALSRLFAIFIFRAAMDGYESATDMAYDKGAPNQLRQFHLLRECKRNMGSVGFSDAKASLGRMSLNRRRTMLIGC